jgi:hypothetical protein
MSISALLGHKVKRTSASPNHKTSAARGADSGLIQRKKRRLREWRIFSEESRKFSVGEKGESGLEFWGKFADFRPIMVPPVRILFAPSRSLRCLLCATYIEIIPAFRAISMNFFHQRISPTTAI